MHTGRTCLGYHIMHTGLTCLGYHIINPTGTSAFMTMSYNCVTHAWAYRCWQGHSHPSCSLFLQHIVG